MITRQYRPSRLRRLALPAATAAFLSYFAYHSFHGEFGIVGRARLETRVAQLTAELDGLKAQKRALEERVVLLRPERLDQDMVDERARTVLSMTHPNDIVILRPRTSAALQNN